MLELGVELGERVRSLARSGRLNLPFPGGGHTVARHHALAELGRASLSEARLAEAHTDALAILNEDDRRRPASSDAIYGVWASDGPNSRLSAVRTDDGWRLQGIKQYCSGAGILDAALVTAHSQEGLLLFEVSLHTRGIALEPSTWTNAALADTVTRPVRFESVSLEPSALVGGAQWYLKRAGFWHGAMGPAACWAGGALSLIDAARDLRRSDPHSRAQLGALEAAAWGLNAILDVAGREIDADPGDRAGQARTRALKVRHLIERSCADVLDRFGRATGPQLLAFDAHVGLQHAALTVYMRQCHAERDLETIPPLSAT